MGCAQRIASLTESNQCNPIGVNPGEIPDYIREELAAATLDSVKSFLRQSEWGCSDEKDD